MQDSGLLDIRDELDLSLTYWHVMDSGRDSADLLVKLLDQFGDSLPLVVVLNEVRGGDFTILDRSINERGDLQRLLKDNIAVVAPEVLVISEDSAPNGALIFDP